MKMASKATEVPASPKAEAKVKAFKVKKAGLKGVHSHNKKDIHITHLPTAQDTAALKQPKYPWKSVPRWSKLERYDS